MKPTKYCIFNHQVWEVLEFCNDNYVWIRCGMVSKRLHISNLSGIGKADIPKPFSSKFTELELQPVDKSYSLKRS